MRVIKLVNEKRPDIKNLIIDDWQYTMCNEFMRRATETGFTKFTEIGQHAWLIIRSLVDCRRIYIASYCLTLTPMLMENTNANPLVRCWMRKLPLRVCSRLFYTPR